MKKSSVIATLITVICLGAMAGVTGCQNTQDKNKGKETGIKAENKQPEAKPKPIPPPPKKKEYKEIPRKVGEKREDPYKNTVDFEALQEINTDAYAWIKIPGTVIDYPILQSATQPNNYYLMRTIDLRKGYPGSIYTEKYNSRDFLDPVTVVYGHDMLNGSMFAALHKYESAEFFSEHPYFYVYLPDETLKYRIFSAVAFNDNHIMLNYDFKGDGEEILRFYNDLMGCGTGNKDDTVIVTKQSNILTMSTCIGPRPDQRWLVSGVLLSIKKDMEDS